MTPAHQLHPDLYKLHEEYTRLVDEVMNGHQNIDDALNIISQLAAIDGEGRRWTISAEGQFHTDNTDGTPQPADPTDYRPAQLPPQHEPGTQPWDQTDTPTPSPSPLNIPQPRTLHDTDQPTSLTARLTNLAPTNLTRHLTRHRTLLIIAAICTTILLALAITGDNDDGTTDGGGIPTSPTPLGSTEEDRTPVAPTGQTGTVGSDENYTSEGQIRERITDIYANRGLNPPGDFEQQIQRVQEDGTDYYSTIRHHADRAATEGLGTPLDGYYHPTGDTQPTTIPTADDINQAVAALTSADRTAVEQVLADTTSPQLPATLALLAGAQDAGLTLNTGTPAPDGDNRAIQRWELQNVADGTTLAETTVTWQQTDGTWKLTDAPVFNIS